MIWAIVPVKALTDAKSRLAAVLDETARRRLVLAMLEDVLAALGGERGIACVLVVTPDAEVAELARARGCAVVDDDGDGQDLNAALALAASAARAGGARAVLVVPGDVPLVSPAEIGEAVRVSEGGCRWVLVASGDGGTNLVVAPAGAFTPAFGSGSFERHRRQARVRGFEPAVLDLPGCARDIDAAEDLAHLLKAWRRDGRQELVDLIPMRSGGGALLLSPSRGGGGDGGGGGGEPQAPDGVAPLTPTLSPSGRGSDGAGAFCPSPRRKERQGAVDQRKPVASRRLVPPAFAAAAAGLLPTRAEALALAGCDDTDALMALAEEICLAGHGRTVTYSRKVFIPLTQLCRDVCHYCTFAHAPRAGTPAFLAREAVLDIARKGAAAGCKEALFTLGDKPELRYSAARDALATLGHDSTLGYLEECAGLVLRETGLLPHLNPGILDEPWLKRLRAVSASQGIMLETASARLSAKGGPHHGSPDKDPAMRLATLEAAGRAAVPFTTGILMGIGETRAERIEALLAIRDVHERHGHIQEIIIQNFRAKPGTRMAKAPEPDAADLAWTIAVARLVFGPAMSIQAPPNLSRPDDLAALIRAGINDWGGVSPVTPDHVNPEAPWPHLDALAEATARAGRTLAERLAITPAFALGPGHWLDKGLRTPVLRAMDGEGFAREEAWAAGSAKVAAPVLIGGGAHFSPPNCGEGPGVGGSHAHRPLSGAPSPRPSPLGEREKSVRHSPFSLSHRGEGGATAPCEGAERAPSAPIAHALSRALSGHRLDGTDIVRLFAARGPDLAAVCAAADELRARTVGDAVTYVVNRNINYTNVCTYGCKFCAFSKGRPSNSGRDRPYDLALDEIARRTREAWTRGATEVCLQGGIAARYTGDTYLSIVTAVKEAAPDIHVHAFSPLEVWHGATTLGLDLRPYLRRLKDAGLSSLPGTAAEILDDEVRAVLCPDKITTDQWLAVMRTAHEEGLGSTATIMFGHMERPIHWARHLLRVRDLQEETGGFTELVPLAFVHMESPVYLKGEARRGPTFREALLMHAAARLVLHPLIRNIQASWVKLGPDGAAMCLDAGANDLGGVLMNESITRAAGAAHGQEMSAIELERLIRAAGRRPRQRTTFYGAPPDERIAASFAECEARPGSLMAAE